MRMVDKEEELLVEFKVEDTEGRGEEAMMSEEVEEIDAKEAEETKTEEKISLLLSLIEQVEFSIIVVFPNMRTLSRLMKVMFDN